MRVASLIMLILAVSYSQQAQGVCVFDLDRTLIGVEDKDLSRAAVKACEEMGFKLAINTTTPSGLCGLKRFFHDLISAGVSYGKNVPNDMWMCRGMNFRGKKAKTDNMKTAMEFYNTTKECMVLYDDNAKDVRYVNHAGFQAIKVNHDSQGISAAESAAGLAMLKGCFGCKPTE
jgi:hypothetical protein